MVVAPADQEARTRFATELERNFSVMAAAGAGKTRAVTDRIAQIAQSPHAETALPRLVVLTFTNRAADEMQQRARAEIQKAKPSERVRAAFNRAWFGTIHAFCLKLLTEHGHHLGLPAPLELVTDDDDLWSEFVQQETSIGRSLTPEHRQKLLRLAPVRQIMELARCAGSALLRPPQSAACPEIDLTEIRALGLRLKKSEAVASALAQLDAWEKSYRDGAGFVRWPLCSATAQGIDEVWARAFAPLRRWVNETAICVAAEMQRDYRHFRLEQGIVTYGDQIALADELLQHPEAARRLRQLDHIVILDEAQDTDPAQFSVLLEITRPPDATGRWLETRTHPPRAGRFCMVGDFQQSIYRERADLAYYQRVHDALVAEDAGEALTFSVTFRLDQRQLEFVNATFAGILNGAAGQVTFLELQPRPSVLPGQVVRLAVSASLLDGSEKQKDHRIARAEANELARWLAAHGPEKLRARSWREVAILCPRRDWLRTMAVALRRRGLPVEVQSERDVQADSPAYAWLTALCTIMAEPANHYEIVGVLHEVFGLSDHDLAVFAEAQGSRFQIEKKLASAGIVSSQLGELAEIRAAITPLPLFAAVELLIERSALRARLASLPAEDFHHPLADLETLLTFAAESEAGGATLAEFAERLRSEMERQRPTRLSAENAIQLITAQKAKGSEWDAVIVPFLGRRIYDAPVRYPSLVRVPETGEVIAALYKEDRATEVKEALRRWQRQEMERLAYVAVTRARHTLVLVHDRELFANANRKIADSSQLKLLRGDTGEPSASFLEELVETPEECAITRALWSEASADETSRGEMPPLQPRLLETARRNASVFTRKHNPSGFEEPSDAYATLTPAARGAGRSIADTPATLYGSWWHTLFQEFPWKGNEQARQAAFAAMQPASPDPDRSAREWNHLKGALSDSVLARFLTRAGVVLHAEYPFLCKMNDASCMEGVIDLLVIDPHQRQGLIVDWKTNRVSAAAVEELGAQYRPQLAAYWKAVSEITRFEVAAALYSTSTGELLTYKTTELAAEWARLEELPPEGLGNAVAVSGL
ncbi:MAG: UvrD-helicase domain-containing protein [Chthoniobacterales bacterium]